MNYRQLVNTSFTCIKPLTPPHPQLTLLNLIYNPGTSMSQPDIKSVLSSLQQWNKQAFQPQPPPQGAPPAGAQPGPPAQGQPPPGVDPMTGQPVAPSAQGMPPPPGAGQGMQAAQGIPPEELEGVLMQMMQGMDQLAQVVQPLQQQLLQQQGQIDELTQALTAPAGMS